MRFIKKNQDALVVAGLLALILLLAVFTLPTKRALAQASQTKTLGGTTSGTLTLTREFPAKGGTTLECWVWGWTSDANGDAEAYYDYIDGTIERVVWNPGAAAPSANYDVTLTDQDGLDLLNATGQNRHTTNTEGSVCLEGDGTAYEKMTILGRVTFTVDNAGNAKNGEMRLYIRR